jgi:AAA+ superfamily predicted ATPase
MEHEHMLILARILLSQLETNKHNNSDFLRAMAIAGLTQEEATPEILAELIKNEEERNCAKAAAAEQAGVDILFLKFCRENKLEGFSRRIIMLLLISATSNRFVQLFDLCNFGETARKNNKFRVGTIVNIICHNYREQLDCHKIFSQDSPLIQQGILYMDNYYDDASNVLEKKVCLYERFVRYLIDDQNLYKSSASIIQRETGTVSLEQVVIPDETKKELVSHISNYLAFRDSKDANILDEFYSYGTALAMLFYGPSGTGKTMMAQALACHFNRPLYSLRMSEFKRRDIYIPSEDVMKDLFLEAAMNSGIVFLDEADDFFENDSYLASLLLIQIEKAHCVVILSTNKPVDLDPAMDRRLSLKIHFQIPSLKLRHRMWQALMPDFIKLSSDVDFNLLAQRYHFTGGLIKNSIFIALTTALMSGNNGYSLVTMDMIEKAAELQVDQMVDMSDLYQTYTPACKINDLQINPLQKNELVNVAKAYRVIMEQSLGLNMLITSSDIETGIKAAEALAYECDLKIKKYDYMNLYLKNGHDDKVLDPVTQKKISPMNYAFAENTGETSLLLFVDYTGVVKWTKDNQTTIDDQDRRIMHLEMRCHLREYQGLFCMVTIQPLEGILPVEFNLHFNMEYPTEETQIRQWEKYLPKSKISSDQLLSLVENNPMHAAEIDFIARQAIIQATVKSVSDGPGVKDVSDVIFRYRPKRLTPLLFGNP